MLNDNHSPQDELGIFQLGMPDTDSDSSLPAIMGKPGRAGHPWLWLGIISSAFAAIALVWVCTFMATWLARHENNQLIGNELNADPEPSLFEGAEPSASAHPSVSPVPGGSTSPNASTALVSGAPGNSSSLMAGSGAVSANQELIKANRLVQALGVDTDCQSPSTSVSTLVSYNSQISRDGKWLDPNASRFVADGLRALAIKCNSAYLHSVISQVTRADAPEPLRSTVGEMGTGWIAMVKGSSQWFVADGPGSYVSFTTADMNSSCTIFPSNKISCTALQNQKYLGKGPVTLQLEADGKEQPVIFSGNVGGLRVAANEELYVNAYVCKVSDNSITCTHTETKKGILISDTEARYLP